MNPLAASLSQSPGKVESISDTRGGSSHDAGFLGLDDIYVDILGRRSGVVKERHRSAADHEQLALFACAGELSYQRVERRADRRDVERPPITRHAAQHSRTDQPRPRRMGRLRFRTVAGARHRNLWPMPRYLRVVCMGAAVLHW